VHPRVGVCQRYPTAAQRAVAEQLPDELTDVGVEIRGQPQATADCGLESGALAFERRECLHGAWFWLDPAIGRCAAERMQRDWAILLVVEQEAVLVGAIQAQPVFE
jgi:hypothetical protein